MSNRLKKKLSICLLLIASSCMPAEIACAQNARDDYAIAANYYARGSWSESASAFRELIKNHPDARESADAKFYLAEVMMQQREFGPAFRAFQIFIQENPKNENVPRATFRMGEAAYRTNKYEIALRVLEDFVKAQPHDQLTEFALPYLGEMRLRRDEPQLAQRAFETALRMFPSSKISNDSRLGLAKSLQFQGNDAEAMRFYQFLVTQPDANLYGEAHLQMGIISFAHVDFPATENHLREALTHCKSKQSQAEATYWLARTHNELRDYKRAIELLKTIVDNELPRKLAVAVLFDGAIAADKSGQGKLALVWLDRLRKQYPGSPFEEQSLGLSIEILKRNGDSDRALALIHQFKKSHTEQSSVRTRILETEGRAHYEAGRYVKTIEVFESLLQENQRAPSINQSDIANWHYLKSLGHLGLGDFENAESELSQIDAMAQSDELKPLIQIARATARFGAENFKAAIENYRSYLKLSANGAESKRARTELTICLAEANRWDECAAAFEDLASHHQDEPIVISTARFLAERAYEAKQIQYAERWFTLMANPGNDEEILARGLSGLAWIKMETSDSKSAYEVFERLLTECPDSKFSNDAAMARAKFLEDENDYEQAAQMYGLVIRQFGDSASANVAKLRRAHVMQKLGGNTNLEESRILLEEYLALPSGNPLTDEALYQLGWVLHDLGHPDLCIERFTELVDSEPESKYWPDAAFRVLQDLVFDRKIEEAKLLIRRLRAKPNVPLQVMSRVLFIQGQLAASENQWPEVTTSMGELIQHTDDVKMKTKAEYWLAESLYRQKAYSEALAIFERVTPAVNQLDSKLEPWVLLRTAQCFGNENDWPNAVDVANGAKSKFPAFEADYELDFVLARGLEDEGKLSDARKMYEQVVSSKNGGASETAAIAQWRIGEIYFHQEEYRDAIKAYHKVDSLFTFAHWRSAALFQAGKCQEHLKNNLHAIKLYTQLIENFPETEFVVDARARRARLANELKTAEKTPSSNHAGNNKSRR